jgi:hypothetical protein
MAEGLAFSDLGPEPPSEDAGDGEARALEKAMPKASEAERAAMLEAIKLCARKVSAGDY